MEGALLPWREHPDLSSANKEVHLSRPARARALRSLGLRTKPPLRHREIALTQCAGEFHANTIISPENSGKYSGASQAANPDFIWAELAWLLWPDLPYLYKVPQESTKVWATRV